MLEGNLCRHDRVDVQVHGDVSMTAHSEDTNRLVRCVDMKRGHWDTLKKDPRGCCVRTQQVNRQRWEASAVVELKKKQSLKHEALRAKVQLNEARTR